MSTGLLCLSVINAYNRDVKILKNPKKYATCKDDYIRACEGILMINPFLKQKYYRLLLAEIEHPLYPVPENYLEIAEKLFPEEKSTEQKPSSEDDDALKMPNPTSV